jgi:hypothetical protein
VIGPDNGSNTFAIINPGRPQQHVTSQIPDLSNQAAPTRATQNHLSGGFQR